MEGDRPAQPKSAGYIARARKLAAAKATNRLSEPDRYSSLATSAADSPAATTTRSSTSASWERPGNMTS